MKAEHVLLLKDYIRYKLNGEYAMDKANSAGAVLFDLKAAIGRMKLWALEILRASMPETFEDFRPIRPVSLTYWKDWTQ